MCIRDSCKAAVYGYGPIGKLLYEELKKAGCDIPYIVDKNPALQAENIHIYHDMENLKKVDVIIVTAMYHSEDVYKRQQVHKRGICLTKMGVHSRYCQAGCLV